MTSKKARKPYPEFPLFLHASGQWAKKIRGKLRYFGTEADKALQKYVAQRDDLQAGRQPSRGDGLTIGELSNKFLTAKLNRAKSGEITERHFRNLYATCRSIVNEFGASTHVANLRPNNFENLRMKLARGRGLYALGNQIRHVRMLFKFAFDLDLIDRPLKFGPGFKPPTKKSLRIDRQTKAPRMLEAGELQQLLKAASVPVKAMILLGINCGFGNTDISSLPLYALEIDAGVVRFPRPKTGIERKCFLWPETTKALRQVLAERPIPRDPVDADVVFVTKYGGRWVRSREKRVEINGILLELRGIQSDSVSAEFAKLLQDLGLKRRGSFYILRHTFATIAAETGFQVAVNHIMGHSPAGDDMPGTYRERVSDGQLRAVTDHVRRWLFSRAVKDKSAASRPQTDKSQAQSRKGARSAAPAKQGGRVRRPRSPRTAKPTLAES
jgi:integrase